MSTFFQELPKVVRVTALERVCIQFPYRLNQQGKPANIVLNRTEYYDLDQNDLDELDSLISNLLNDGSIIVEQIGYATTADNVGYTNLQGNEISVQEAITIASSAMGGRVIVVTGNTTLLPDQLFCIVNSTSPVTITLPSVSSVLQPVGSDTFTTPFVIKNINTGDVTVAAVGSDLIDTDPTALIRFDDEALTILPYPNNGWAII